VGGDFVRQYSTVRAMDDDRAALARAYPLHPATFAHALADHPLLTLDALADAAAQMNPAHVEVRRGDGGAGGEFAHLTEAERAAPHVIRHIAASGCWAMLRFAEQLPTYRALMEAALAPFADVVRAQTGPMRDCHAFVFIASDAMVTPFHCDAEYNILFQISGDKSFRTFPPGAPFMSAEAEEHMHRTGENLLRWDDAYLYAGTDHRLVPGDALYVPYKAPHLVTVAAGPSISLSLTWKSDWSMAQDEAHRFNAALRKIGLRPFAVPPWPARTPARTVANKLLRRAGWQA
jgi:hypothetical protein